MTPDQAQRLAEARAQQAAAEQDIMLAARRSFENWLFAKRDELALRVQATVNAFVDRLR